jgi:glutamate-1-semialdehyde 2,1-aminomutase
VSDFDDTLGYDKAKYARFAFALQERGVRTIGRGLWYVSHAHTDDDIDFALATARDALKEMA